MRARLLQLLAIVAAMATAQAACGGVPLKGVDVKLGKNPGGGCAARAADGGTCRSQHLSGDDGTANFPAADIAGKGSYVVSISSPSGSPPLPAVHVVISGIKSGTVVRDLPAGASGQSSQIPISLDGSDRITVTVTAETPGGLRPAPTDAVKPHGSANGN